MSEEANLAFLRQLATQFSKPASTVSMGVEWERGGLLVGVSIVGAEISVYFGSATRQVMSNAEASEVASAIFADRLAFVTGYAGGEPVYFAIAPPDNPAAGISALDKNKASLEVPFIEEFDVVRWSETDKRQ